MISLMLILGLLPPGHLTTSPDEVALWQAVAEGHAQAWNHRRVTVSGVVSSIRIGSVSITPAPAAAPVGATESHNSDACIGLLVSRPQFRRLRNRMTYRVSGSFMAIDLHPDNDTYVNAITRNGREIYLTCPDFEGVVSFIYVEHISRM
jgi:hypothetical protein